MTLDNIRMLARAPSHLTIHNTKLKNILTKDEYGLAKKYAKLEAKGICQICGKGIKDDLAENDNFFYEEKYDIDKKNKIYHIKQLVGICQECYYFINQDLLFRRVERGELSKDYHAIVILHGREVLAKHHLQREENTDLYNPYVVEYRGEKYMNDIFPIKASLAYLEGVKIVKHSSVSKNLPETLYYKTENEVKN